MSKRVDVDPESEETVPMPLDLGPDFDPVDGKPNYFRRKSDGHLVYAPRRVPEPPSKWDTEP